MTYTLWRYCPRTGFRGTPTQHDLSELDCNEYTAFGPTALVAGLRCFVLMTLGDTVEIPKELL